MLKKNVKNKIYIEVKENIKEIHVMITNKNNEIDKDNILEIKDNIFSTKKL